MASRTFDQKRLSQLRTQLYGKQPEIKLTKKTSLKSEISAKESKPHHPSSSGTEAFIMGDLTKVVLLSALVLLIQFAVHYALQQHWITINFYGITY